MEQKAIHPIRDQKRNFALSITGKPMQLSCSLNEFRLRKKKEPIDNQRYLGTFSQSPPLTQASYYHSTSNLPVTSIPSSKAFLFSKKYKSSLTRSYSKAVKKKEKSICMGEKK